MRNKTKEIDVWIDLDPDDFVYGIGYGLWKLKKTTNCTLKAKLLVEIPEKKITITESEFDSAIALYGAHNLDVKTYSGFVQTIKKELGFTDD